MQLFHQKLLLRFIKKVWEIHTLITKRLLLLEPYQDNV